MVVEAVGEPWTPEEARGWVARALVGVEWVHIAPLARSDFPPETLAELSRGRRLSLDGQGLVRGSGPGPLRLDAEYDPALLRHVSILKLAEEEAHVLVEGLDEVIVTLGSRGAVVLADGLAELVPARRVQGDPDPTGSGDAFAAAYLAARAGGDSPPSAARRASALVAALLAGRAP